MISRFSCLNRIFLVLIASGCLISNPARLTSQETDRQSADSEKASQDAKSSDAKTSDAKAAGAKDADAIVESIKAAYQSSTQAETQSDFSKTIRLCRETLKMDVSEPQKKYLHQLKAWALLSRAKLFPSTKTGQTKEGLDDANPIKLAIHDCTEAIMLDPANWKAHVHRAKRYVQQDDLAKAVEDLSIAIRRQPGETNLWFNRAELLYAQGKYEIAITDYSEVLKLDATDVQALTGRAHCYSQLNKPDLALADYDAVLERTQKNAVAYLNRADLHLKSKRFKLAGEDYRDALIRDQTLANAYRGVAWMYATSETDSYFNPTVADRSVKKAIELDGRETPRNLVVLAAAQASAGDYSMARDTMKRVRAEAKLSTETKEKLEFLETRKWYLAGTGKK